MDMYRRRPARHQGASPSEVPSVPEHGIHGFCYRALQACLVFGSDRREPLPWRRVVSWTAPAQAPGCYVLPATTRPDQAFFHLPADACFTKRLDRNAREGYLCPRVELVPRSCLTEQGVLPHPKRLDIAAWLRARAERVGP
jgi:hypothetical protein